MISLQRIYHAALNAAALTLAIGVVLVFDYLWLSHCIVLP